MKTLILVLTPILLFTSCKKYPEGGSVKKARKNIEGLWILKLYEVNGIDSTDLINYNGNQDYKKILFIKEQTRYSPNLYCRIKNSFEMIVNFKNNNTLLSFYTNGTPEIGTVCSTYTPSPSLCYKIVFNPEQNKSEWKIIELTKQKIILSCKYKNQYKVILTK